MPTGSQPGMAYEDIYELIYSARPPAAQVFSIELMVAICWEESLFNNIEQQGGTAWGFGQVEPAEMYRCENDDARKYGYYVPGLPPRIVVSRDENNRPTKTKLGGNLTPEQSVKVIAGALCSFYYTVSSSVVGALKAYAGVAFTGDQPERLAAAGARLAIVQGWLDCETWLKREWKPPQKKNGVLQLPDYPSDYPTFIKTGLNKARKFELKNKGFDDILFPKNSVSQAGERVWRPQRVPGWLADALKI
jgi:hypothetical protein